ncbi:STAS/SEC14 domain-containing protein [Mesorhizobium microcysteis]|jgi:hypothetical protein|uniref:STAS/SEC14 domain-containing protein n=1 Tax=Neoaquamicrobium microcysteis TaxID=2682781 RepID=A0A5D4GVI4_9HYPH|nr:STAS/SEC14 domain-containing protein [Mesorhizobium microcysteis]TYR32881.1 STAS/SEC14 domain-containing protein [Mesorhizobium microcysteis]
MRPLERVPAVRRIETDRADAFAVEITGEFTSADAENLCGLLEGAYALNPHIDLLVRLVDLTSVDIADLSPETAAYMRTHVAQNVGKCAVIDDGGWASRVTALFEPGSGAEARHFSAEDEQQAWEWIGAREIEERV